MKILRNTVLFAALSLVCGTQIMAMGVLKRQQEEKARREALQREALQREALQREAAQRAAQPTITRKPTTMPTSVPPVGISTTESMPSRTVPVTAQTTKPSMTEEAQIAKATRLSLETYKQEQEQLKQQQAKLEQQQMQLEQQIKEIEKIALPYAKDLENLTIARYGDIIQNLDIMLNNARSAHDLSVKGSLKLHLKRKYFNEIDNALKMLPEGMKVAFKNPLNSFKKAIDSKKAASVERTFTILSDEINKASTATKTMRNQKQQEKMGLGEYLASLGSRAYYSATAPLKYAYKAAQRVASEFFEGTEIEKEKAAERLETVIEPQTIKVASKIKQIEKRNPELYERWYQGRSLASDNVTELNELDHELTALNYRFVKAKTTLGEISSPMRAAFQLVVPALLIGGVAKLLTSYELTAILNKESIGNVVNSTSNYFTSISFQGIIDALKSMGEKGKKAASFVYDWAWSGLKFYNTAQEVNKIIKTPADMSSTEHPKIPAW